MAQVKIEITFDPSKETLAQAIAGLQGGNVTAAAEKPTTTAKSKVEKPAPDPAPAPTGKAEAAAETPAAKEPEASASATTGDKKPEPEEKPVSKTDVRAVATALSKAGKRDELKAAFAKFGGSKLSDIKESDYPALMRELVSLNG